MNIGLWILLGILSACFFVVGGMKLSLPLKVFMRRMGVNADWEGTLSNRIYKLSGTLEITGAIGLLISPLSITAAVCLLVLMTCVVGYHIKIHDKGRSVVGPVGLIALLGIFIFVSS